jgi:hypothetical protein
MDRETRNALQGMTQRARVLLSNEFREQLEATYDVMRTGAVAASPGSHLGRRQVATRARLVEAVAHKRAAGMPPSEAFEDFVRDSAFTALNRFAALKMLEARGLLRPCIGDGELSAGYATEFAAVAPELKLLPDGEGYRLFVECIFDELSTEVRVLFDRRDPASILWPKRAVFDELLMLFNDTRLAAAWTEDETIGWIYQFFNSGDERRAMREASQSPRNRRELAVRNQFFTPAYVVKFLVDNTLGRIWLDMTGGRSALAESCAYMVREPDGAAEGEAQAKRERRDPRDVRALDPACGSGHFLLGLFDLYVTMYEEGWEDPDAPPSEATGRTLRQDYGTVEELSAAMPGLILRHNLHGVDIDARCAQIAQFALWLRAQRAFDRAGIARAGRPRITRTNVVAAEPMPGELELLEDFLRGLHGERLERLLKRVLGAGAGEDVRVTPAMAESLAELVRAVWVELEHAGDMGLLLRIEHRVAEVVAKERVRWTGELPLFSVADFAPSAEVGAFGDGFWNRAEALVLLALSEYAASVAGPGNTVRKLFVEDAAQGFALVDLAAKRFDVVVMNPPFGAGSLAAKAKFESSYPLSKVDVYAAFVERGIELLRDSGRLGAITSRTGFFLSDFTRWRREVVLRLAPPVVFADLGAGVLDGAMVETAAYCLEAKQ